MRKTGRLATGQHFLAHATSRPGRGAIGFGACAGPGSFGICGPGSVWQCLSAPVALQAKSSSREPQTQLAAESCSVVKSAVQIWSAPTPCQR